MVNLKRFAILLMPLIALLIQLRLLLRAMALVLPPLPPCVFRITPAGLLEWGGLEPQGAADLTVRVDASNPALLMVRALAGELPPVAIEGDAQLAGDINWLLQNLRWDVAADMERLFGPVVAQQLHKLGSALTAGVRAGMKAATDLAERLRSRGP